MSGITERSKVANDLLISGEDPGKIVISENRVFYAGELDIEETLRELGIYLMLKGVYYCG